MTSVAQLALADIFQAGIRGDSRALDRKSPGESGGTKERGALRRFDLVNQDGNTLLRPLTTLWVALCVHMRVNSTKEKGRGGLDLKMLTLSSVLGTCF